jgi:putative transcriptional regulator
MAIVRYTFVQDPQELTPDQEARLAAMTPAEIEAAALSDPDNPPSTDEELQRGVMARDVRMLRQSLGLSQSQFAERFRINPSRLRDWEQGRHLPDSAARAYLAVIRHESEAVERALAKAKAPA